MSYEEFLLFIFKRTPGDEKHIEPSETKHAIENISNMFEAIDVISDSFDEEHFCKGVHCLISGICGDAIYSLLNN